MILAPLLVPIGIGTVVNIVAIVLGSLIGLVSGHRFPERMRELVIDSLGVFTIVIGILSVASMNDPVLTAAVGAFGTVIVLLSVLLGAVTGSWLQIEERIDQAGDWLKRRSRQDRSPSFVEGFVTSTIIFCIGPLTLLGSLSEGLGQGPNQLVIKALLDGFTAIAFASTFGIGVMAAAFSVAIIQGSLTLLGYLLGDILPAPSVLSMTATGGVLLIALGLRLLKLKTVKVGDLTLALIWAPVMTWIFTQVAH